MYAYLFLENKIPPYTVQTPDRYLVPLLNILPSIPPGFSVTAPWAFIWFLDGNENKVVISIVGTNEKYFLINAHGVLRRMGAVTEIPGSVLTENVSIKFCNIITELC